MKISMKEIEEKIGISLGVEVIEETYNKNPFEIDIIHTKKQLILDLGLKGEQHYVERRPRLHPHYGIAHT